MAAETDRNHLQNLRESIATHDNTVRAIPETMATPGNPVKT